VTTVDVELCKFITVLAGGGESSAVQVDSIGGCGFLVAAACARVDPCFLDGTVDDDDDSMERFLLLPLDPEALALALDADVEYIDPVDDMDDLFLRLVRALVDAASSMGGEILSL
jgi:hypothetical protein